MPIDNHMHENVHKTVLIIGTGTKYFHGKCEDVLCRSPFFEKTVNPLSDCYNVSVKGGKTLRKDVLEVEWQMTNKELEQCIYEYGTEIYSFCRYLTRSPQEADDLYQDTFLKAVELNGKIDAEKNPKSYLLSIALRIWKNRKRKFAWRKRITEEKILAEEKNSRECENIEQSPEEKLLKNEEQTMVRRAVEKLQEKQKIVILLYYMEELSVAQIAEVVNVPVGTVKSRLYQARKMLEKELEDVLNEERIG